MSSPPLLYVLTSEVLANQIRKNSAIEGFLLPGTGSLQFKISQYADKLKILGVYVSNGLVNVDEDNWHCKLDKLKKT